MKQLIKNELIKLRAQKTYVVLSCIVLALVIVVSFFTSVLMTPLNMLITHRRDFITESAAYTWAIDKIKEDPDSALAGVLRVVFKDPQSEADIARQEAQNYWDNGYKGSYAINIAQAEYYDFRDQNDLPAWIAREVEDALIKAYRWRDTVKGLQSGLYLPGDLARDYTLSEVLYMEYLPYGDSYIPSEYYYYVNVIEWDKSTGEAKEYEFIRSDRDPYEETVCAWEEVLGDLSDELIECEAYIAMLEQYALSLEPDAYYDQLIMQYRQQIESENEGIANYQAEMEELEPDQLAQMRPYYEVQINDCRREIADHEYVISLLEKLKEQDAYPESNSFKLVNTILPMMLRERRNAQSDIEMDAANDEFFLLAIANKSSANHRIRTLNKAQIAIEYAVERNILPEGLYQSSAKNTLINNLSTASFLISAITVVLASMILSREFATGTVRLWVIRPKTRNKLLGSKIATLLIYVCTMMGASFVITYFFALINHVVDLFFYGQSTLFVNNYGVLFGKAVAIPAVAEHVWALIVLTLPVILYAMLCLFISVLTKKGVLSIVCGMIVLMFASDIQALVLIVANYTGIFGYALQATVLPYLGMNRLLVTSMDFGIMSSAMELDNLGALLGIEDMLMSQIWGAMPYVCSSFAGAVVLVAHILLLVWASLFAFKRTQIKS